MSWMAWRSFSSAAQAYISSMVLGGSKASKRPNAFRGPVAQPYNWAIPITASMPCFSVISVIIFIGSW